MGKGEAGRDWPRDLEEFIRRIDFELGGAEAILLFGSAAKGQEGIWSDLDVLVVSDAFKGIPIMDRLGRLLELKVGRIEAFGYTYPELERMVESSNPLALNALIEGKALRASDRVLKLIGYASKTFARRGRVWYRVEAAR